MAGIALGRFSDPVVAREPGRGWGAGGEHARGDEPEIPAPARRRAGLRGGRAVSPGPLRIIPSGRLGGEYAVEALSHAVGHRGRGNGGEERGDLSQLAAKHGAATT